MAIEDIRSFCSSKNIVGECQLSTLSQTRLGIDIVHYINRILAPNTHEPLIPALGGLSATLAVRLEADLKILEKQQIKPVFVLPGISLGRKEYLNNLLNKEQNDVADRKIAWEHYENNRIQEATDAFGKTTRFEMEDVLPIIYRIFKHRRVEFVVAPYLSNAQLVYLLRHTKNYIHAIYGPTEILAFDGVDKVIDHVDFSGLKFQFYTKSRIISELKIDADQFFDACILAGSDLCSRYPPIKEEPGFQNVINVIRQHKSGASAVASLTNNNNNNKENSAYSESFARARGIVKFSHVLVAGEGRVLPLPLALPPPPPEPPVTTADIPEDISLMFSYRLPDEVYFYIFRALLSPTTLSVLTTGYWIDSIPLYGGHTDDYKSFVKDFLTEDPTGPRAMTLALMATPLHHFWLKRPAKAVCLFDNMKEIPIVYSSSETVSLAERVGNWNIGIRQLEEELRRQNSSTIDIALCIGATSSPSLAAKTFTPRDKNSKPLEKKDELTANIVWRFLEMRGFLNASHEHKPYAKAFYTAIQKAKVNDRFQEPLYLVIELIRAGVLHGDKYGGRTWSGGPHLGSNADKRCLMLITRVVSIIPLVCKTMAWKGPVSRELLVFNAFVRTMSHSLRSLMEATLMNALLRGDGRRDRNDYLEISTSLPFQFDTNTGMGIVVKGYCDAATILSGHAGLDKEALGNSDRGQETKEQAISMLDPPSASPDSPSGPFANVRDVRYELKRAFRFWDIAVSAVKELENSNVAPAGLAQQFEEADAWLTPFRI